MNALHNNEKLVSYWSSIDYMLVNVKHPLLLSQLIIAA
jgi:hypothetical protein